MSTHNRDERIDQTHRWLYEIPDPDNGPLPAELHISPDSEDEPARISADFALKVAAVSYTPIRHTNATTTPDAHVVIKVDFVDDGTPDTKLILYSESPNYEDLTITVPLLIHGSNLETIEASAATNLAKLASIDQIQELLYAAIPDAINDAECTDWYHMNAKRQAAWNALRPMAEDLFKQE